MADKPTHRLVTKPEGADKWTELAAGWSNAKGQITFTFKEPVPAGAKALLVKNEPKAPSNG